MVLDGPLCAAKDFISVSAWFMETVALIAVGVGGTDTLAEGVVARSTKDELVVREGVNGADVGTIRDIALLVGSSFMPKCGCKGGCAWGR